MQQFISSTGNIKTQIPKAKQRLQLLNTLKYDEKFCSARTPCERRACEISWASTTASWLSVSVSLSRPVETKICPIFRQQQHSKNPKKAMSIREQTWIQAEWKSDALLTQD